MSAKKRSTRQRNQRAPGKSPFSEKEQAIMQEELEDSQAVQRNLPLFLDLLKKVPVMRALRINPFQVMSVVESRHRTVMTNATFGNQSVEDEQFMDMIVQDFSDQVNPDVILEILIPAAKDTKVKRDKRVLLWAIAEILSTIGAKQSLRESGAVRVIVIASVHYSMDLSRKASQFVREEEPFTFSYKKILDGTFTVDDWKVLLEQVQTVEPDFSFAMSQQGLFFFEKLSRPFGLRFHRIIRYANAMQEKQKSSILMPGQTPPEQEDDRLDEETSRRLAEGVMRDFSPARRIEFAADAIASIKSASFGELDEKQLNACLNAVAFSFLSTLPVSPFLIQLYQTSGEKAADINPEDEKELIIDLKGSPANPRLYQRYGELLEQKGEKQGAAQVYLYLQEISDDRDVELDKKIIELIDSANEDPDNVPKPISKIAEAIPKEEAKSNIIITP